MKGHLTAAIAALAILAACQPPAQAPPPTAPGGTGAGSPTPTTVVTGTAAPAASAPAVSVQCSAQPTTASTEGPFFKAGAPQRSSLVESGMQGTRLVLTGAVVSRSCRPVAGARLEFWQADASGAYDNTGFRLRGHLFTDAQGRYQVETIVPAEYPGRTPHIHVKVLPPAGAVLTTQLYLPDAARNATDSFFKPELAMRIDRSTSPLAARFDFVIDVP